MQPPHSREILVRDYSSDQGEGALALGPYNLRPLIQRQEQGSTTAWRVRIESGAKTPVSYHARSEELYLVTAGNGTAWLGGKEFPLKTGTFLRLPPGTSHAFEAGPEGLEMLDIHTPGCWPDHDTFFVGEAPST
jgi:mannose-6-phosphate isomerase-like protein (cupin superfamily)